MDLKGFDKLMNQLTWMENNIEDDVNTVVKNNTLELTRDTIQNERRRFDKGYWTGYTARNTTTEKLGSMHYETLVNTNYASYLEFGTRYYTGATNFLHDKVMIRRVLFFGDLERLIEG